MALTPVPDKAVNDAITETNWDSHLRDNINWYVSRGADLAADSVLGPITNRVHRVLGTTDIDNIDATGVRTGQTVLFQVTAGPLKFKHNSGGTGNILAAGLVDASISGGMMIEFYWTGSNWLEAFRTFVPPTFVGAIVSSGTTQSFGSSGATLNFDNEVYDPYGYHDPIGDNTILRVPTGLGGIHQVHCYVQVGDDTTLTMGNVQAHHNLYIHAIDTRLFADSESISLHVESTGGGATSSSSRRFSIIRLGV